MKKCRAWWFLLLTVLRAFGWGGVRGAVAAFVGMVCNSSGPDELRGTVVGRKSLPISLLLVALC